MTRERVVYVCPIVATWVVFMNGLNTNSQRRHARNSKVAEHIQRCWLLVTDLVFWFVIRLRQFWLVEYLEILSMKLFIAGILVGANRKSLKSVVRKQFANE